MLIALGSKAEFSAVAGHSLGEYSALVAGGVLSFEDGLRAVTVRGQVMSQAEAGGMLAPLGANLDTVQEVVDELKEKGIIEVANYNAPGQIIISGEKDILKFAAEMLKERGAKKIIPLPVSGAFHSPLMNDAQKEMKKLLDKIEFGKPKVMFYSNVTGDKIESPEEIRKNLVLQITNPVRWMNIIENMTGNGVDKFVEIGPGKVLQGLIARIDNEVITTDWQSILEL
ncbi:[acyl-carrier-protein] S-malonyltransferase [bacterium]|nr:MAG: [acyl-carrier-protein] S-malonyltransferase [bacterium]